MVEQEKRTICTDRGSVQSHQPGARMPLCTQVSLCDGKVQGGQRAERNIPRALCGV